jgi:hypothetical protein
MANTKISALSAASTPLDGTEVLPIVQSSTTKKVTNNDLRPKQIQSNATSGVMQILGPAAAATRVMTIPDANFTVARTDAAQTFSGTQTFSAIEFNYVIPVQSNQPGGGNYYKIGTTAFSSAQTLEIILLGDTSYSSGTNPACRTTIILRSDNGSTITGYFYGESQGNGPTSNVAVNSSTGDIYIKTGGFPTIQAYVRGSMSFTPAYSDTGSASLPSGATSLTSAFNVFISGSSALEVGSNVKVTTGNLVIGTSGKGIDFSVTPNPSGMTSELFADYEEGTWTPGFSFGGGTTGITYSVQAGYYTKVGNIVTVTGQVEVSNKGSSTGNALITGLPYTVANNQAALSAGGIRFANITYVGMATIMANQNTTTVALEQTDTSGNRSSLTNTNFSNFSYYIFSLTYRVA